MVNRVKAVKAYFCKESNTGTPDQDQEASRYIDRGKTSSRFHRSLSGIRLPVVRVRASIAFMEVAVEKMLGGRGQCATAFRKSVYDLPQMHLLHFVGHHGSYASSELLTF